MHFYRVSQSAYWSELDTLSDSTSLPNSAIIPHAPTRWRLKKKKRLCNVFELFCLVNNFMIWKRKKKKKKKKETSNGGGRIRSRNSWITKLATYHWTTETKYMVVVVLRSPIHANEPSEYNGMLYHTSNRELNNGIKVTRHDCALCKGTS